MLRWFPRFQVATTCFSCSPPDLNLVVTNFRFCIHVKYPLPPGNNPIAVNKYYYYYYYSVSQIVAFFKVINFWPIAETQAGGPTLIGYRRLFEATSIYGGRNLHPQTGIEPCRIDTVLPHNTKHNSLV